jgi:predicted type IV restriction endonuclease
MLLKEAIQDTLEYRDDPPPNESSTCDWVILPLLWAAGYARRDIVSRVADNDGKFPDYTLLPNDLEHTWYLEAKAWSVSLEDKHAHQSLNYANQNGKRWVVLTNGRVWRLYDNRVQGLTSDKLVTERQLETPDTFHDFLFAIGKDSVCSGGLEAFAERIARQTEEQAEQARQLQAKALRQEKLHVYLMKGLQEADSDLIQWLCEILHEQDGLSGVTNDEIADWFRQCFEPKETSAVPVWLPETARPALPNISMQRQTVDVTKSLDELAGVPIDGKSIRPVMVLYPDGTQTPVSDWAQMAFQIVQWLYRQNMCPTLPFHAMQNSQRWFLHTVLRNPNQRVYSFSYDAKTIYMDKNLTADELVNALYMLYKALGVSTVDLKVILG